MERNAEKGVRVIRIVHCKKEKYDVEIVNLSDSVKEVIHLIGKWRKNSIEKRNFSYVNVK